MEIEGWSKIYFQIVFQPNIINPLKAVFEIFDKKAILLSNGFIREQCEFAIRFFDRKTE